MIPEKIGKYTVIELLGRGGMGEVYLGEDPYIGRRVAIKIIKGADPDARERFLHEARVIGGLAHPAIVSLLDFDFSSDEPFLVMELLKGQGLDAWIKSPHTLAEQLVILDDVCHALAYAHENGVLHRDVKPSNVQVLPNGHAKLMDFGIARAAAGKLTATGAVMGTPEYMAPEILNDAAYSSRSDLYACAVLLYEMFTGANPFAAKTVAASLTNVLTLNPPDLRTVRPGFPKHLAETLMACLRKEPEMRPDGFDALIRAGQEAGGGPLMASMPETRALPMSPAQGTRTPRAERALAPVQKRETPWAWFGGAGALATIGLVWVLNRNPAPTLPVENVGATQSPSTISAPSTPGPLPTPSESLTPVVEEKPTPRLSRSPHVDSDRVTAPATATPLATPLATAIPTPVPPPVTPTPQPRPSPTSEPVAAAPPVSITPATPSEITPKVFPSQSRTVRRGSSVDLEVRGEGFRKDLIAVVLQGRRPAEGIKVLQQVLVSGALFRVRLLIDNETPLLTYSLIFQDKSGLLTQGVSIEVVL
jgi:serine/threonine protein kinase